WKTRAPLRSRAVRPSKYLVGTGTLLHASIIGLQGVCKPNCVRLPSITATNRIVRTAIGLRFQLFSPSPAKKGSSRSTTIPIAGPIISSGVSADGGRKDKTAYSHRKKKSGRGAV